MKKPKLCRECSECAGHHHWAGEETTGYADCFREAGEPMPLPGLAGVEIWDTCKHCDAWSPMYPAKRLHVTVSHGDRLIVCSKCKDNLSSGRDALTPAEVRGFIVLHAHSKGDRRARSFMTDIHPDVRAKWAFSTNGDS